MRTKLVLVALCFVASACSDTESHDDTTPRGALLFDLTTEDIQSIHDRYVADEDMELTTARLTAPFDCALYDDLCAQIGTEQAIDFTEQLVELALEGASDDEVHAFSDAYLMDAMDLRDDIEATSKFSLRSSTAWATDTSGNVRLQTRNGITTPIIGSRQAWTEARTQRRNAIGIWNGRKATEICVNTGTNTQTSTVCGGGIPCSTTTIESFNPSQTCVANKSSHKSRTYHNRNNGSEPGGGFSISFTLRARGSANAEINGANLSDSAGTHSRFY